MTTSQNSRKTAELKRNQKYMTVEGYPWEIDDTRSPDGAQSNITRQAPPPHSEADFDMEGPQEPFIPKQDIRAFHARIAQAAVIQTQA